MRGADRESSRTRGGMRWTRKLRLTSVTRADGEDVSFWRPTLALSFAEMIREVTVAKELGSPGSNCVLRRPVIGRPQDWRCAPPPSAADGLDPVRSLVFWLFIGSVPEPRGRAVRQRDS